MNVKERKEIKKFINNRKINHIIKKKSKPLKRKKKLKFKICYNCHLPKIPLEYSGYRCRLCSSFPICSSCYVKKWKLCEFCFTKLKLKGAVKDEEMFTLQTETS
jgi:hypothetical protein